MGFRRDARHGAESVRRDRVNRSQNCRPHPCGGTFTRTTRPMCGGARMRNWVGVLGAVALVGGSLVVTAPAGATDGELDAVLGGDGVITVPGIDHAWDMAAAPGSKVVVVGKSGTQ